MAPQFREPNRQTARKLLITEDDKPLLCMMCWEFDELGYQVTTAASCGEALDVIAESRFDLALLDYNLPDGVGTGLMQELHRLQPGLPVILYSGLASGGKASEAERCGASRFVAKPVEARTLHAMFNVILSQGLIISD